MAIIKNGDGFIVDINKEEEVIKDAKPIVTMAVCDDCGKVNYILNDKQAICSCKNKE